MALPKFPFEALIVLAKSPTAPQTTLTRVQQILSSIVFPDQERGM